ncbi:MAG: hypothetical protein NXY57DRAFT_970443 [Lentinula lateritia]|nr:MAG: hypothetical protein NXY57DRAFT_970443 [Lentinula lateritia]
MPDKSLNSLSFSRFSRMGFGLRIESQSASPSTRTCDSSLLNSEPSSATHPYTYGYLTSTPSAAETPSSAPLPKTHFEHTPICSQRNPEQYLWHKF